MNSPQISEHAIKTNSTRRNGHIKNTETAAQQPASSLSPTNLNQSTSPTTAPQNSPKKGMKQKFGAG